MISVLGNFLDFSLQLANAVIWRQLINKEKRLGVTRILTREHEETSSPYFYTCKNDVQYL